MKFRIKFADQIVGAFVIIALLLLVAMLLALGSQQRWFAKDFSYTSRFNSGTGLSAGMPILLKGFKIGRIDSITLNEKNLVDVTFEIYDTFRDKVTKHSILELSVSPIGLGNSLTLHPGFGDELLEEGAFVPSYDSPQAQILLEKGLVNRPPKDDSIARILSNVNPLLENLNTTVVQVNATLAGINGSDGRRVDSMMGEVETRVPEMLNELSSSVAAITYILENLKGTSDALKDPTGLVPTLLDPKGSLATLLDDNDRLFLHIENSLAQVAATLTALRASTETLSASMPRIGATIEQLRGTVDTANDVLEGVKNNPLIRGGVPSRTVPEAAPQSGRTTEF